jgi:hypothetical protein
VSTRALRRLLWITAVFVAPLPILALGPGLVPAAHQLELGLLALFFGALESAQGVTLTLAAALLVPGSLYAAGLWLCAWLVARALAKLPPLLRTRAAFALVVLALSISVAVPIYVTPFSAHSARSNLLGVYR